MSGYPGEGEYSDDDTMNSHFYDHDAHRESFKEMSTTTELNTWPKRIWLQPGEFGETPSYLECQKAGAEITWCQDHIDGADVEYIRADLAGRSAAHGESKSEGCGNCVMCEYGRFENCLSVAPAQAGSAESEREVPDDVMRALKDARDVAMRNTLEARIPECGDFGSIAQNLDWAISKMERASRTGSTEHSEREAKEFIDFSLEAIGTVALHDFNAAEELAAKLRKLAEYDLSAALSAQGQQSEDAK